MEPSHRAVLRIKWVNESSLAHNSLSIIASNILNNITRLGAHRGLRLYSGVAETGVFRALGPAALVLSREERQGQAHQGLVPAPGEASGASGKLLA